MNKVKVSAAAVAVALAAATSAQASTINVTYQPDGVFGADNLYQNVNVSTAGPGVDGSVSAGMFHLTADNELGDFFAFCVDLVDYLNNPQQMEYQPSLYSASVQSELDLLFSAALGGDTMESVIDTSVESAGLQVAIWEVTNEGGGGTYDLTSGNFSVSGNAAVQAQAQSYLDAMSGATAGLYNMTFMYSADHQDLVTVAPVPLPASGLLIGAGLAGLAAVRRRRKAA